MRWEEGYLALQVTTPTKQSMEAVAVEGAGERRLVVLRLVPFHSGGVAGYVGYRCIHVN